MCHNSEFESNNGIDILYVNRSGKNSICQQIWFFLPRIQGMHMKELLYLQLKPTRLAFAVWLSQAIWGPNGSLPHWSLIAWYSEPRVKTKLFACAMDALEDL